MKVTGCTFRSVRAAFTLIELLVAIAIILVLIIVTLPAIARIIESANYSAAINIVGATLGNARTAAVRDQRYTAVAFLFDTKTEAYTLMPLERVGGQGSLTDRPTDQTVASAMIFQPALNTAPVGLPKGTGVYGLSFAIASSMGEAINRGNPATEAWYAGEVIRETSATSRVVPWIFPRNDPRLFLNPMNEPRPGDYADPWIDRDGAFQMASDPNRQRAVRHANSFCVVFNPLGSVETGTTLGAQNLYNAYIEFPDVPYRTTDPAKATYDDPQRFDPEVSSDNLTHQAIGVDAGMRNPEVALRTASMLAVVDLRRMTEGTGVAKPWLLHAGSSKAPWPVYHDEGGDTLTAAALDDLVQSVSAWIDENAEIIGFDRYSGSVLRRK